MPLPARDDLSLARRLMDEFALATGLVGSAPPRRYLWTDAFAVCNLLGLARASEETRDLDLALRLVDQVHHTLGRHRPDDPRQGWLSGLSEEEGELHPTQGGLRIGKPLPERRAGEPWVPDAEWDRDGQYFHYLTQWMHALERAGEESGRADLHRWAIELARTAHAAFTRRRPDGRPQMVWKMSIDLHRVLVPSTGQHDPLDAWLTYLELATVPSTGSGAAAPPVLEREIGEASAMCREESWVTADPLGIGALLVSVWRLGRLVLHDRIAGESRLRALGAAAAASLQAYLRDPPLAEPASRRLAFRELGLAIGLRAVARLSALDERSTLPAEVAALAQELPLAEHIVHFWSHPDPRSAPSWQAHDDINSVMLATSLAPDGYLGSA